MSPWECGGVLLPVGGEDGEVGEVDDAVEVEVALEGEGEDEDVAAAGAVAPVAGEGDEATVGGDVGAWGVVVVVVVDGVVVTQRSDAGAVEGDEGEGVVVGQGSAGGGCEPADHGFGFIVGEHGDMEALGPVVAHVGDDGGGMRGGEVSEGDGVSPVVSAKDDAVAVIGVAGGVIGSVVGEVGDGAGLEIADFYFDDAGALVAGFNDDVAAGLVDWTSSREVVAVLLRTPVVRL